ANGRDRNAFGIEAIIPYARGDSDLWERQIQEWREAGATHISFNTMGSDFDNPTKHLQALRKFADALKIAD
ncbi:MAG: LLM class F420-dependent oxidoreductase, partial [Anaerolineales bacterium]